MIIIELDEVLRTNGLHVSKLKLGIQSAENAEHFVLEIGNTLLHKLQAALTVQDSFRISNLQLLCLHSHWILQRVRESVDYGEDSANLHFQGKH